ncbi:MULTISPECIES: glycerol dehydrogenase [unclassified Rhizobium]|uniref:glycerol dehydrogenase n=1 Tax=unclassified Rhizobium TaxID=2613769 RepID=UPI001ADBDF4B|nr:MULTISPECIES: glycerol dehydrogenase [unclassified Rhizobium]MBO9123772.1 glycerol dehydrogenase [Rhizobium sp. 16-488-2b]MBO9174304.1 glycerol dehydrogenase [Rhizobium sp. 16-488-2a]
MTARIPAKRPPIMFVSPPKYVQGPGIIDDMHEYIGDLGTRVTLICDSFVWNNFGARVTKSCNAGGIELNRFEFSGQASIGQVEKALASAQQADSNVIIGMGGGKACDVAKAVGARMRCKWVTLATIASTDAPTSSLSVLYKDNGDFHSYELHGKNPDLVLVDTEAVARAPARFLASGMADAVATKFESAMCAIAGSHTILGARPSSAGLALGALAWDNCRKYGLSALKAVEAHAVTPAVELIVETNTFHSGVGFESGGFSGAHSVHNGITHLTESHVAMHGEIVNFGILVQLTLEGRADADLDEFIEFSLPLGLPVTLEQIGLAGLTEDKLRIVSEAATAPGESIHWMPFKVDADMVAGAIIGTDAYVREYLKSRNNLSAPFRPQIR